MRKLFQIFFAAVLCSLSVLSCTEDDSGSIIYKGQKELVFLDEGGVQTIQFETPELWTASVTNTGTTQDRDWALIGSTSGDAGDNTVEITVKQNEGDKERTAAVSVFCGGDVLVVSIVQSAAGQGGGDIEPDVPGQNSGSKVSRIVIKQDGDKEIYDLKYDGKYVSEMTASSFEDGIEDGKPDVMKVIRETGKVRMENRYWDEDYDRFETNYFEITLDDKGRAVKYSLKSTDGYNSGDYEFSYNPDGKLAHCQEKGSSFPENVFIWTGGNLTEVERNETYPTTPGSGGSQDAPDYTSKEEFRYSEYKNDANIDLNWVLSGGYDTDWAIEGMLDLLGERSANYVVPKSWSDYPHQEMNRGPIPSDGEYTYTVADVFPVEEETVTDYKFNGDNLTGVKASVPVYRVETTYKVYRTITDYEHYTEGPNGQKLYFEYDEKVISKKEISREKIGSDEILFEFEY